MRIIDCEQGSDEWRPVVGYEGLYEVSSTGEVRSLPRSIVRVRHGESHILPVPGGLLKPLLDGGYYRVNLYRDKKRNKQPIHRLVLMAFSGPPPTEKHICRHLDGNHLNNTANNLAWGTHQDNADDAGRHGTRCCGDRHWMRREPERARKQMEYCLLFRDGNGERNGRAKLTEAQVKEIRKECIPGSTEKGYGALAIKYGVTPVAIGKIYRRETWRKLA